MNMLNEAQVNVFLQTFPLTKQNESMALHTYMKIGGPARLYLVVHSDEELIQAVQTAIEQKIPWYILGGGSNVLVADEGYQGIVIQADIRGHSVDGERIVAKAGDFTGLIARIAVDAGLVGFEWGAGVPGTIGGAVYGNAGCFGGEMKDVVSTVDVYNVSSRMRKIYTNAECQFAYRESRFKREPHVILGVSLQLKKGDSAVAKAKLEAVMAARKESQPQGTFSAGCLFKNVEFADESNIATLRHEREIPTTMLASKCIAAGWIIDTLGLKGKSIGKAQISTVHGNFLVNLGGARAQDVIALSSFVKMKARDELGILLQDEVQYLGF